MSQLKFVSIPNGMKFYHMRRASITPIAGFNSQRDEILPKVLTHTRSSCCGFNSQRDEILLWVGRSTRAARPGFKSQRDEILLKWLSHYIIIIWVSIPNGMKFYAKSFKKSKNKLMFQFPTGWNSTLCCSRLLSFSLSVSIPNGMKFYATAL